MKGKYGEVEPMTYDQALEKMRAAVQYGDDTLDAEGSHIEADKAMASLLLGLGYDELVKMFLDMEKWYA